MSTAGNKGWSVLKKIVAATTVAWDNVTGKPTTLSGYGIASPLPVNQGGTGATTAATACDNILPSGEVSGYILKTSGAGTYYWAAETGSGGTVGTTIATTQTEYTATAGQTSFTGLPAYTIGAGQTSVFIDGVRQYPSDYTEASTTSITLGTGAAVGSKVLVRVDRATAYAPTAADISNSPAGNIAATNVQSALNELDSEKAPKTSGTSILYGDGSGGFSNVTVGSGLSFSAGTLSNPVIPAGTVVLFYQAAAPTGWTQVTTQNNKALRVVSGVGAGTGGTNPFTTSFASYTPAGTHAGTAVSDTIGISNTLSVSAYTLLTSDMPSHSHAPSNGNSFRTTGTTGGTSISTQAGSNNSTVTTTDAQGGGAAHSHGLAGAVSKTGTVSVSNQGTFTGTASTQFAVQYIDIIICSKN